jgi:TrpR-related protein YerC/YecD
MEDYPRWRDELTDQLFKAILLLKNEKECYKFFEDLATIKEIKEFGQRLEVARMLGEGYTYDEIAHKTGASSATISRVKKYLNYGADGYKLILRRLSEGEKNKIFLKNA